MNRMGTNNNNWTMEGLITLSNALQGLKQTKLLDEGNKCMILPSRIIRNDLVGYQLPELVIAREFTNIMPTLTQDYSNYKLADVPEDERGVFMYDLNQHLVENLLQFRQLVMTENWINNQSESVRKKLLDSKYYTVEDYKRIPCQKELLYSSTSNGTGVIRNHIDSYQREPVFFADPQIQYRLSPEDNFSTCSINYRINNKEEAEKMGMNIGDVIDTPWSEFASLYLSTFYELNIRELKNQYSKLSPTDFNNLPEVKKINDRKLISNPQYKVLTLCCSIKMNEKDIIELVGEEKMPTNLCTLQMKANHFQKFFNFKSGTDYYADPSMLILKMNVPKLKGTTAYDFKTAYEDIRVSKPESTYYIKGPEGTDERLPNMHPVDRNFSKRMKETILDFPFDESYVTSGNKSFGKPLNLVEMNKIMQTIGMPLYEQARVSETVPKYTKENMSYFFKTHLKLDLDSTNSPIETMFYGQPADADAVPVPVNDSVPVPPPAPPIGN